METIFFWVAWGLVSSWVIRTYYFSYSSNQFQKLRLTAFGLDVSVLLLFFLPWLPASHRLLTGWQLIPGSIFVLMLFFFIATATVFFLMKQHRILKAGAVIHMMASVLFLITMVDLMPQTYRLTFQSIAPIIASLLLFIGNVVVLLLWQQLQLKEKKGKYPR